MKFNKKGVTAPKGFSTAYTSAGIKKNNTLDMAMIYSKNPCVAAGTFTTNKVCAAPVLWDKHILDVSDSFNAIVINSGVANACTSKAGYNNCKETAKKAASVLSCNAENVFVCSTGVIGAPLPLDKIKNGIKDMKNKLDDSDEAGNGAARAIMTTDTRPKEVGITIDIDGKEVVIGGMCKGAGMIHPNMATMLCFVTTDALIDKNLLNKVFKDVIDDSFNMISVDGDTSTNDTALILANGAAGNSIIDSELTDSFKEFKRALKYVCIELAKMIAGDGEGCTCLFEAQVCNALTENDARTLAKSIITSDLTKAAIFGHDANWGRILCAMGYSGAEFDPENVDIFIISENGRIQLVKNGVATNYSEEEATKILSGNPVTAFVDVKQGDYAATAWGCDLTFDYVKINADYRS